MAEKSVSERVYDKRCCIIFLQPSKNIESHSIGNRVRSLFRSPGSDQSTANEMQQPKQRSEQIYAANGGSSGANGTQTVS